MKRCTIEECTEWTNIRIEWKQMHSTEICCCQQRKTRKSSSWWLKKYTFEDFIFGWNMFNSFDIHSWCITIMWQINVFNSHVFLFTLLLNFSKKNIQTNSKYIWIQLEWRCFKRIVKSEYLIVIFISGYFLRNFKCHKFLSNLHHLSLESSTWWINE